MKNYTEDDIKRFNQMLDNEEPVFDAQNEYEHVILSLVTKIRDLYGRGTILSMTYQIGADGGLNIAEQILKERNGEKFDDPIEALVVLSNVLKERYTILIESITTNEETNSIELMILNKCAFRDFTVKYDEVRPGGSVCRIGKGFFETALKKIIADKYKIEIFFKESLDDQGKCRESITFTKK